MGPQLGQPQFVLGGGKDVSTREPPARESGSPVLAPIAHPARRARSTEHEAPRTREAESGTREAEPRTTRGVSTGLLASVRFTVVPTVVRNPRD